MFSNMFLNVFLIAIAITAFLVTGILLVNIGRKTKNKSALIIGWVFIGVVVTGAAVAFTAWAIHSALSDVRDSYFGFAFLLPIMILAGFLFFLPIGVTYLVKGITTKNGSKIATGCVWLTLLAATCVTVFFLIAFFSTSTYVREPVRFM